MKKAEVIVQVGDEKEPQPETWSSVPDEVDDSGTT